MVRWTRVASNEGTDVDAEIAPQFADLQRLLARPELAPRAPVGGDLHGELVLPNRTGALAAQTTERLLPRQAAAASGWRPGAARAKSSGRRCL